jgi:hypothetical protein
LEQREPSVRQLKKIIHLRRRRRASFGSVGASFPSIIRQRSTIAASLLRRAVSPLRRISQRSQNPIRRDIS